MAKPVVNKSAKPVAKPVKKDDKAEAKKVSKPAAKTDDKKAPSKKPAFAREMDMKFGISDLARALDLDETYTRAKLRQHGVEKEAKGGTAYGWNTRADLDEVVKLLSTKTPAAKKEVKKVATKETAKKSAPAKAPVKKAASTQKVPTGMPKPNAKTPEGSVKGAPHAPKDGAIKKVAKEHAAGKKALNK